MKIATIRVQERQETGTKKVRRLREQNKIPAVVYGGGKANLPIAIDYDRLSTHLRHHLRVYKLQLDGRTHGCYLKDVQWDTLTDEPLHVDFERIDLNKPIQVEVELLYLGHPKGISHGGRFIKDLHAIQLTCLPEAIPENVELKVEHLDLHDRVLAGELELPEACELDVPPDTQVCHITGEITIEEIQEALAEAGEPEAEAAEVPEGAEAPAGEAAPEGAGEGEGDKPAQD